jgi:hypothetical protein
MLLKTAGRAEMSSLEKIMRIIKNVRIIPERSKLGLFCTFELLPMG